MSCVIQFSLILAAVAASASGAADDPRTAYTRELLAKAGQTQVELKIDPSLRHAEEFRIRHEGGRPIVEGGSPAGLIYGAQSLLRGEAQEGQAERPDFDIRGTTLCLMGFPADLSGYVSTLSKEQYAWFFDKPQMERFLDAMVAGRLNTLFVWSGHMFPYILEMPKYPQACELSKEQLRENQEQFRWFTRQCARRNIRVLLHMYNIQLSKPQARVNHVSSSPSAPTPLVKEYTYYALSRFFEEFDSVGLYICPGESLQTQHQLEWFRDVIFRAAKDCKKNPLLVIRDWHLSPDLRSQIKTLYENIYSELKHNNESLTSPVPDRLHQRWKEVAKAHVVNLHGPPTDLTPIRWGSPLFIGETVSEWKKLGFVAGAEVYTLSFWKWPYALDKLEPQQQGYYPPGRKLLWLDRDSIYLAAFGRYLWKMNRDPQAEQTYWEKYLAAKFGSAEVGRLMYRWYALTGPITPGMQNLTATAFSNFYVTSMLQNQGVDLILKARKRIDDPVTADSTTSVGHYSLPVDTYFFQRYKAKYDLPQLTQRVSMPVAQYAVELSARRKVTDAMTPEQVCDLLCELACESLAAAQTAQTQTADPAAKEELARFVTDSQMYVLATEAFRHKISAALLKARMLTSGDKDLAEPFLKQMEDSVAMYRKLAELTDRTYLFGNDLMATHWKKEGLNEFTADLQSQKAWLKTFLAGPSPQQ